jgi:hypothetical protein
MPSALTEVEEPACYHHAVSDYPLVVKNKTPLYARVFMLLFVGGVALITYVALRDGAPAPQRLWPWIMAAFWASALFGLWWAMNQEVCQLTIKGPGSITVTRGKAFRREEHWIDRARFWIEDTKDSDGDPYFKLMTDAPGGKLTVKEGHSRTHLEGLQQRIETAVSGR